MLSHEVPGHIKRRWVCEDVAHIEFDRMKAMGVSDRLALECAIRAFGRMAVSTSEPAATSNMGGER